MREGITNYTIGTNTGIIEQAIRDAFGKIDTKGVIKAINELHKNYKSAKIGSDEDFCREVEILLTDETKNICNDIDSKAGEIEDRLKYGLNRDLINSWHKNRDTREVATQIQQEIRDISKGNNTPLPVSQVTSSLAKATSDLSVEATKRINTYKARIMLEVRRIYQ